MSPGYYVWHSSYDVLRRLARQEDKQKHFIYSLVLLLIFSVWLSVPVALLVTLMIGVMKEIYDHFLGSGFCWFDMLANALGMLCGSLSLMLFQCLLL